MAMSELGGAAAVLGGDEGAGGAGGEGGADAAAAAAAAAATDGAGGEGAGGDGGAGGGEIDPDWYGSLGDKPGDGETASNRDYVKAKGFKDIDGVVKAYRAAEKGLHDSGRIKVPGENASDDERAAFYKAIGVPEDVSGYEIKLPETNGGLELDTTLIGSLAEKALAAGTPKAGFEAVANAFVEMQVAQHLERVALEDQGREETFKAWGAEKAQNIALCNSAMRALGLSQSDIAAMQLALAKPAADGEPAKAGSARVFEILKKIGGGIAEDVLTTGGAGRWGITPAEAQSERNAILADPEKAALAAKPGTAENTRWNRLIQRTRFILW